jgi:arsenite methyltransferase
VDWHAQPLFGVVMLRGSPDDCAFDAVTSECSFCTFPDKTLAAREMVRVLRPGGRLDLTDVTVRGRLSRDLQPFLAWGACVGGAATSEEYVMAL